MHFTIELGGRRKNCLARLAELKHIKSSNGISELRAVIETDILIGATRFTTDITLTDRADMGVPMLLGRAKPSRAGFWFMRAKPFIFSRRKQSA